MNRRVKISDLSIEGRKVIGENFEHLIGGDFDVLFSYLASQSVAAGVLLQHQMQADVDLFGRDAGARFFPDRSGKEDSYTVYTDGSVTQWYKGVAGGFNIHENAQSFLKTHAEYFEYVRRTDSLAYEHIEDLIEFITAPPPAAGLSPDKVAEIFGA